MGYRFVGVAAGERARALRDHGATEIIEDYETTGGIRALAGR
jgi:hypothetical protein